MKKSMGTLLRAGIIVTPLVVALVAIFIYSPLVDGIEDRYRAMVLMAVDNVINQLPYKFTAMLGYGAYFDYIRFKQRRSMPDLTSPPRSAGYGGMTVKRTGIAGRTVIIYRPKHLSKDELLPGLIYLHGGGWALENPDSYDSTVYPIANCSRKITISVDYRLSPEHPFPAPVHDCLDVTRHILKHGKVLGVDVSRVGIAGDGAGGNLAAAVALRLASEKLSGLPPLKFQVLLWPPLQAMDFQTPSYVDIDERISILGRQKMIGYWALYLGLEPSKVYRYIKVMVQNRHVTPQILRNSKYSEYIDTQNLPIKFRKPKQRLQHHAPTSHKDENKVKGSGTSSKSIEANSKISHKELQLNSKLSHTELQSNSKLSAAELQLFNRIKHHVTNPLFSPLMAPDLGGLPSTLVLVSEFDVLRDDGLMYAHRLRQAGVRTQVFIAKGFHGDFYTYSLLPEFFQSITGQTSLRAVCAFLQREA